MCSSSGEEKKENRPTRSKSRVSVDKEKNGVSIFACVFKYCAHSNNTIANQDNDIIKDVGINLQ
jgi:hypothetical protein